MSIPDSAMPAALPGELLALLRSTRMTALRHPSTDESGIPSGLYVCRDKGYSVESLVKRFRQVVRQGLEQCEIRAVESRELLTEGLVCNRDTMRRQGRFSQEFGNAGRWARFVEAVGEAGTVEVTGAFVDGKLGAYILACPDDGWWNLIYSCSRTHLRKTRANHALWFRVVEAAIRRPEIQAVCAGPKTLFTQDGLHDFKTWMGFALEPHDVIVRFHPALERWAAGPAATGALRVLRRAWPNNARLTRIEALLRSAREARRFSGRSRPATPELGAQHE